MDVTERKNAQEAVRAAKARFEGILAIADDAIISLDSSQQIVLFNQGAEKVFGYAQDEIIGKSLDLLLPDRFTQAHRKHIEEFAKSPDVSRTMGQRREVFGRRKDGGEFPAEASISKLNLGGELVFTVILRDITERKEAAEALRASEHLARGQLAALTSTLDSLAQESDPDNLPKHVVTTILKQMGAHSATIWERNADELHLLGIIEQGRFKTRDETGYFQGTLPVLGQAPPLWVEALGTAAHTVIEDVNKEASRVVLSNGRTAVWHASNLTRPFAELKAHLTDQGVTGLLISPMMFAGHLAGIIGIRFTGTRVLGQEEIELTKALAHQAMLAVQLMRLSQQSRQAAVEAERNRMARDIHDTLAQGFTGVIVQLEAAADATSKGLAKETEEHLRRAGDLARESLREARRSVRALRPQVLEDTNLCKALEDLIRKMTEGTTIRGEFRVQGEPRSLAADWEENLLRVGQEILTNALRHAQATEFKAELFFAPTEIRLELRDNGRGFDPTSKSDGLGLIGIRERMEALGGQFIVQSRNGSGTTVLILLPWPNSSSRAQA
jgi:PAS domain S-box-containing protein